MADPVVEDAPAPEETSEVPKDTKVEAKDPETATAADSVNSEGGAEKPSGGPIVSSSKKTRPSYKYDPDKITLRFLFANNDGLTVTIECDPTDTVGEVKGALMSVWPDSLPECSGGDNLRLICMGKGYLMPESRTLKDCEIPVFKTHPTPINVTVRPDLSKEDNKSALKKKDSASTANNRGAGQGSGNTPNTSSVDQGCACTIL